MPQLDTVSALYPNFVTDRGAANYDGVIEVNTLYGALWGHPADSTAYFDALLKGIQYQQAHPDSPALSLNITRVEFVYRTHYDKGLTLQGAILFDQRGQAALHFGHALLGIEGPESEHSRNLLQLLGVPAGVFGDINTWATQNDERDRSYVVVLQKHPTGLWEIASLR